MLPVVKWVKSGGAVNVAGVTITRVAGTNDVAAGDVLIGIYKQRGGAVDTDITPTGWTRNPQVVNSGQYRNLYHKVIVDAAAAAAEPTSYTFDYNPGSGSASQVAMVVCLGNVDTSIIQNAVALPSAYQAAANIGTTGSSLTHPALTSPSSADLLVIRGVLYTGNANAINPTWDPALTVIGVRNFGSTSEVIGLASEVITGGAAIGTRVTVTQDATLVNHTANPWFATTWALPGIPSGPTDPVLQSSPSVTGGGLSGANATRGIVMNGSNGTWTTDSGGTTVFTPHWQRSIDGGATFTDIGSSEGAATLNFTPGSPDQTFKVRLAVTAVTTKNGIASNPITAFSSVYTVVPPVPVVGTPGPTITGTPRPGNTLNANTGTWTETPSSFSLQWHLDSGSGPTDLTGQTGTSVVVPNTPGGILGLRVVAHNAGGDSAPAESNTLTIVAAFQPSDIQIGLTGGSSNSDSLASLGGNRSTVEPQIPSAYGALLPDITSLQAVTGYTDYVCVDVHNANTTDVLTGAKAFLVQTTSSPDDELALALDPAGSGQAAQTIVNRTTAPVDGSSVPLVFATPTTLAAAISLSNVPIGGDFKLWVRRVTNAGAAEAAPDTAILRIQGTDGSGATVIHDLPISYGIAPPEQQAFALFHGTPGLVGTIGLEVRNLTTQQAVIPFATTAISEVLPGYYVALRTRALIEPPAQYSTIWSTTSGFTLGTFSVGAFDTFDMVDMTTNFPVNQLVNTLMLTALAPLAITPGTMATILRNNLDAPVSSRARPADVDESIIGLGA